MRELLKCKLPAFWYSGGVRHRTPEPVFSPSPPLTLCWLWGGRETELGKTKGLSYRRPAGWTPHHGGPKERQWLHGNGRHCTGREQAAPATGPGSSRDCRKALAAGESPTTAVQGTPFLGQQPGESQGVSWWNLTSKFMKDTALRFSKKKKKKAKERMW